MPKKRFEGEVLQNKMEKTVVVAVKVLRSHPVYLKRIKRTKKYKAHDELEAQIGDWVLIEETRPLSRRKRFRVVEILKKG